MKDVPGQLTFDGKEEPERKRKPKKRDTTPIEPVHRVFNLTQGPDAKFWLPADQFVPASMVDKSRLVQENRKETPI